ncbi:hypothetical protein V8J82_01015 [Gymnodinialimonas sp. 2305UL16-5]|uniref:hypothetical protein n=1 Tax=Gymnodinialimonas mytili TaxID=3126503 RepID=UPI0030A69523
MTEFLLNQTKSYTLTVSKESGEMRLELADDLKENLRELLEEADTSAEAAAGFFDILGDDAPKYLDAMDELLGAGGGLAESFATGGVEALDALLAELAASSDLTSDFYDRLGQKEGFGGFGSSFVEIPGRDVEDIFGYGVWDGENPNDFDPAGKNAGLMEGNGDDDHVDRVLGAGAEGAVVVGGGAAVVTGVVTKALVPTVVAGVVGGIIGGIWGAVEEFEDIADEELIPADPDSEYAGFIDFTPPWVEDQVANAPTYGQTLTDPENETYVDGHTKAWNPDAELAKEMLIDPERAKDAIDGAKIQDMADEMLDQLIIPVDRDDDDLPFQFRDLGGEKPDLGGGEDFVVANGANEGEAAMVQIAGSDTFDFHSNVEPGQIEAGSDAEDRPLEAALHPVETQVPVDLM